MFMGRFRFVLAGCGDNFEPEKETPAIPSGEWRGGARLLPKPSRCGRTWTPAGCMPREVGSRSPQGGTQAGKWRRWEENYRDGLKEGVGNWHSADGARTEASYLKGACTARW